MKSTYASKLFNSTNQPLTFSANDISECPLCKKAIKPVVLNMFHFEKTSPYTVHCHFLCTSCQRGFIANYQVSLSGPSTYIAEDAFNIGPNHFTPTAFDKKVEKLSSQFVKIYNQASAAEASDLNEIAGLGYRKALEFLIKDYAIYKNCDAAETIKALPLAQCIRNYIDDPRIVTLAERSTWIGNDEAHYIRKQENRDVSDMKEFIQALVYFIGMVLITDDAASMTPKK